MTDEESDIIWYSIHIFDTITSYMQAKKNISLRDRPKLLPRIEQYVGRFVNKPSSLQKISNEIFFNVLTMLLNKQLTREEMSSYFYHPTQLDILFDMKEKVMESIKNTLRATLRASIK